MEFKSNRPIYLQIMDYCYTRILTGQWQAAGKIPSVRELAVTLSVNVNTILKAYEGLEKEGVIYTRRGLGYFLSDDATGRARQLQRQEFFNDTLPQMFSTMDSLDISIDEIIARYHKKLAE